MKAIVVDAKVPENKEKGVKAMAAAVSINYAETVKEAVEMFGEEAILSNALANWKVTVQSNIRSALKRGESVDAIAVKLAEAKMGIAQTGTRVDPIQAYLATFASATPEKQQKMLKELQARAAQK